jgi:uncharacterized Zn-binding protein involved in type VI secretion
VSPTAKVSDMHASPIHGGNPIAINSLAVMIDFMSVPCIGGICTGSHSAIARGSATVMIGG